MKFKKVLNSSLHPFSDSVDDDISKHELSPYTTILPLGVEDNREEEEEEDDDEVGEEKEVEREDRGKEDEVEVEEE